MNDRLSQDIASLRIDKTRRQGARRGGARRAPTKWLITVGALALAGVVGWQISLRAPSMHSDTVVELGHVSEAAPSSNKKLLTASGFVTAREETKLAVAVGGRVIDAPVSEGDVIEKEQLLLELDALDQRSAASAAAAKIDAARARAAASKAQLEEIQQQIRRQRILVDKQVKGRAVLEDLQAKAKAQKKAYEAAVAESKAVAADANTLHVRLRGTRLESPLAGTIVSRVPRVGEVVGPTGPFIEIVDLDSLVVVTDIPEGKLYLVDEPGTPCEIVLEAYPDKRFPCETKSVGTRVDRAKATVPVRVVFTEETERVLPNMSASVTFFTKDDAKREPNTMVASAAVIERDGRQLIYVVDNGVARSTPVTLGDRIGKEFVLLSGPSKGTQVVLNPPEDLDDQSKVRGRESP